jgi:hypothetical protein
LPPAALHGRWLVGSDTSSVGSPARRLRPPGTSSCTPGPMERVTRELRRSCGDVPALERFGAGGRRAVTSVAVCPTRFRHGGVGAGLQRAKPKGVSGVCWLQCRLTLRTRWRIKALRSGNRAVMAALRSRSAVSSRLGPTARRQVQWWPALLCTVHVPLNWRTRSSGSAGTDGTRTRGAVDAELLAVRGRLRRVERQWEW